MIPIIIPNTGIRYSGVFSHKTLGEAFVISSLIMLYILFSIYVGCFLEEHTNIDPLLIFSLLICVPLFFVGVILLIV